jgi:hypothetical protein
MGAIIIGFLYALLYCAIVILIAFLFVWGMRFIGISIDGQVYKWGQVVVRPDLRHYPSFVAARRLGGSSLR